MADGVVQVAGHGEAFGVEPGVGFLPGPLRGETGDPPGPRLHRAARPEAVAERDGRGHEQDVTGEFVADDEREVLALQQAEEQGDGEHGRRGDDGVDRQPELGGGEQRGCDRNGDPHGRIARRVVGEQPEHGDGEHDPGVTAAGGHQGPEPRRPQVGRCVRAVPPALVGGDDERQDEEDRRAEQGVDRPRRHRGGSPFTSYAEHALTLRRARCAAAST